VRSILAGGHFKHFFPLSRFVANLVDPVSSVLSELCSRRHGGPYPFAHQLYLGPTSRRWWHRGPAYLCWCLLVGDHRCPVTGRRRWRSWQLTAPHQLHHRRQPLCRSIPLSNNQRFQCSCWAGMCSTNCPGRIISTLLFVCVLNWMNIRFYGTSMQNYSIPPPHKPYHKIRENHVCATEFCGIR
jgi:hypothetical protein